MSRTVTPWLLAICWILASPARADWPRFLGPNGTGRSEDKAKLTEEEPSGGLKPAWRVEVGAGFAGPIVTQGRCLIYHRQGKEALLDCLDAVSGKRIWRFSHPTDYVDDFGFDDGPRSTPTASGDRVIIHGAEGMLHCLSLADGKPLWKHDLAKEFASPKGFFGRCSSPLAVDDRVVVAAGGEREGKPANLLAFSLKDGALIWSAADGEADYASGTLAEIGDRKIGLFFLRDGLAGVDVRSGGMLFREPFRSPMHASVNAASPVVEGRRVFLSACYEVGAGQWDISPGGDSVRAVYRESDRLDCHFATPVLHQGKLYGFHGRQESGQELRCLDWETAKVLWKEPMSPGSLIVADGKLLILTEKGELIVAKASPTKFEVLWRAQILGAATRAAPALSDGQLFARDGKRIERVDLRQP